MKKMLFFVALLSTVLLSNCNKDKKAEDLIIGRWNATSLIDSYGDQYIISFGGVKIAIEMEFTESGNVTLTLIAKDETTTPPTEERESTSGTYNVTGDNQLSMTIIDDQNESHTVNGTITVTKDKLTFDATGGDIEFFFQSFDADKI